MNTANIGKKMKLFSMQSNAHAKVLSRGLERERNTIPYVSPLTLPSSALEKY